MAQRLVRAPGMELRASLDQQGERQHVENCANTDQKEAHAARAPRRKQIAAHGAADVRWESVSGKEELKVGTLRTIDEGGEQRLRARASLPWHDSL